MAFAQPFSHSDLLESEESFLPADDADDDNADLIQHRLREVGEAGEDQVDGGADDDDEADDEDADDDDDDDADEDEDDGHATSESDSESSEGENEKGADTGSASEKDEKQEGRTTSAGQSQAPDDDSSDYFDDVVLLEFPKQVSLRNASVISISGIHLPRPVVRIDKQFFIGRVEETVGSLLLYPQLKKQPGEGGEEISFVGPEHVTTDQIIFEPAVQFEPQGKPRQRRRRRT